MVDQEDRNRRQALSLQPLPAARGALPKNKGPGDQSAAASAKATAKLKHRLSAKTPAAEAVTASASAGASATASAVVPFQGMSKESKKKESYFLKKLKSVAYHAAKRKAKDEGLAEEEAKEAARAAYQACSRQDLDIY